jgi:hypothetical protein
MDRNRIGSSVWATFAAGGDLPAVLAGAAKRAIVADLALAMAAAGVSRAELARRMRTSRVSVRRLLDPGHARMTLATLTAACAALGLRVEVRLVPAHQEPPQ